MQVILTNIRAVIRVSVSPRAILVAACWGYRTYSRWGYSYGCNGDSFRSPWIPHGDHCKRARGSSVEFDPDSAQRQENGHGQPGGNHILAFALYGVDAGDL